ncbi:serine/threonine protein phosphatase Azr1 [Schizosaccharomyces cryophilus OY26]|uniref:Protein phosphatase n=1 Tax=Schizosaccharomyces cryophilus (strain OY26 / ATCC MYA-4695 / CBS 11777 / NBRC 106824 / NRRL Y48691) TaxID=653667 RepID=S9XCI4_SCHCR|nr:serine/threonine protein phosphatase Azr1 [Schizosaccharomyces cryophilus OY26]EPY51566.1 serine/threonine protein phosphatase Azr1 [Schizosaccharomyces cryophilus OY26]
MILARSIQPIFHGNRLKSVLFIKKNFIYTISSATSFQKKPSSFVSSGNLDHPDAGEDAFSNLENSKYAFNVVLDGVGGWTNIGIDPSKFSWGLIRELEKEFKKFGNKFPDPLSVMTNAFDSLKKSKSIRAGSSTACATLFDKQSGKLHSLNLGDSGFLILRDGSILYESTPQVLQFNMPYQLAIYPSSYSSRDEITPNMSDLTQHQLQNGDLIILATDGVFDNLDSESLRQVAEKVLSNNTKNENSTRILADSICKTAVTNSKNTKWDSPFSKAARSYGFQYRGGKVDDTTTTCMLVKEVQS